MPLSTSKVQQGLLLPLSVTKCTLSPLRRPRTASYWEGSATEMIPHTFAMPTLNAKGQKRPRNHFSGSGRFSISTVRLRHPKRKVMRNPTEPASLEVLKREQSMKTRWICKNRIFLRSLKEINIFNSSTSICQANRSLVSWVCVIKYTKVVLSGLIWVSNQIFCSQPTACQTFRLQFKSLLLSQRIHSAISISMTMQSIQSWALCKRLWSTA